MKKLFLIALSSLFIASQAHAGSSLIGPKPQAYIDNQLTADNSSWTGLKYSGAPLLGGADSIASNVNYIYQIVTTLNNDLTMKVQIYLRSYAQVAYTIAKTNINNTAINIGVSGDIFQDSGIIMQRSQYDTHYSIFTPVTKDWSWQIIETYNLDKVSASQFNSDLSSWVSGKLNNKTASGNVVYYWK